MPIYDIDTYVHTSPPTQVPTLIPRLYIPEYMDIATVDPSAEAAFIVSAWNVTLNAVIAMPHKAHTIIDVMNKAEAAIRRSCAAAIPISMHFINTNLVLS